MCPAQTPRTSSPAWVRAAVMKVTRDERGIPWKIHFSFKALQDVGWLWVVAKRKALEAVCGEFCISAVHKERNEGCSGGEGSEETSTQGVLHTDSASSVCVSDGSTCMMSDWITWSPCSVSCGMGTRSRERYVKQFPEDGSMCKVPTEETEKCVVNEECCKYFILCTKSSQQQEHCPQCYWGPTEPCALQYLN